MKRSLYITCFAIVLLGNLVACGTSKSADHPQGIQPAAVIKVGTSADNPPFEYFDNSGKKAGFDIAVMEEIARRLGVKLEWVDLPFNRLFSAVQAGKIDIAISAIHSSEIPAEMVSFSDPYYVPEEAAGYRPMSIVLRKHDQELAAKINKIMDELTSEGYIEELSIQYLAGVE